MAEMLFNGKRLEELKVVEIREELSRRGLSRKGIKSILIKRFEKILLQERLDQETEDDETDSKFAAEDDTSQESNKEEPLDQEDLDLPAKLETVKQEIRADQRDDTASHLDNEHLNTISSQDPFNNHMEEDSMEVSFTSTEDRIAADDFLDRPVERLESVTSIIEPSFPRDEELIYEGDVDNEEGDEPLSQVDMDVEEEEEKDELIVDFTAGELDLDPKPFERERITASATPSKPSLSSNDKSVESKLGASKVDTEESSEERCNLWVSGLSQLVSASDLKTLFSPFGQVISAKVVARAKSAKTQRYGFVTLASPEQAEKSIQSLHNTELKGQVIAVELAKGSPFVSKQKKGDGLTTGNKEAVKDGSNDSNQTQSVRTSLGLNGKGNKSASKNDTDKGIAGDKTATNKRIISVEKTDGRKELYTASGRRRRDEQRGGRVRSRSPRARSPRARSRSPRARRRGSPRGRIVAHRLSPVRRITGNAGPMHRRGMSPPMHRRMPGSPPPMHRRMPSPPPMHRRMPGSPPPMHRRMASPPPVHRRMASPPPPIRRGGGANDDVRRDLIRREMERRDMGRDIRNRLGGRIAPPTPPPVHQLEMRLEEQRRRMISERERERDALRRQIEIEHSRKEQELVRQMQEMQQREERERSLLERQQREFIQLQRTMKEREGHIEAKEREIREKEMRERQRLDAMERQKEKDIREKEKRYRDQLERDLKEREIMMQKEQEMMRMKLKEQERALLDKERQIRAEQEQLVRAREDADRKRRKEDEEKDKDRKDRRMSMYPKDDKDDKDRLGKRNIPDDGIFGRLGNQSSQDTSSSHSAIVKETQISPNVMYRRIESSGNKPGAINRGGGLNNPYSQNQSRSKALDSLTANYSTPRHSNNPVGYPQPSRYTSTQYPTQSVGYGGNTTTDSNRFNSTNSMQTNKLTNILNNPDLLNALTNVARTTTTIPQVPMGGGGGSSSGGYSGGMGGGYGSNMGGGAGGSRYYGGSGGLGGVSHGRPGGYPTPSMGMGRGGMGVPQPQFNKHMNKMPQESSDRYNRRAPPRPAPYSHFNKRM